MRPAHKQLLIFNSRREGGKERKGRKGRQGALIVLLLRLFDYVKIEYYKA